MKPFTWCLHFDDRTSVFSTDRGKHWGECYSKPSDACRRTKLSHIRLGSQEVVRLLTACASKVKLCPTSIPIPSLPSLFRFRTLPRLRRQNLHVLYSTRQTILHRNSCWGRVMKSCTRVALNPRLHERHHRALW